MNILEGEKMLPELFNLNSKDSGQPEVSTSRLGVGFVPTQSENYKLIFARFKVTIPVR